MNEPEVGSWAEQQGLEWYEKWEQKIPTKEWDPNEVIPYQKNQSGNITEETSIKLNDESVNYLPFAETRNEYGETLKKHPHFAQKMQDLENLAKQATENNDPILSLYVRQEISKLEGEIFEQNAKDLFSKKIIMENEKISDEAGREVAEIDFETDEAIVEVGKSLGGKGDQIHKLAEIAEQRHKKLYVVFGPDTPYRRLEQIKESVRKKWGNRVHFIPPYPN